ncbi:MAG: hypothetical protein RSE23_04080 [Clostridia bacterium]
MRRGRIRSSAFLLIVTLCFFSSGVKADEALSAEKTALTQNALDACRVRGISAMDFPDDITNDELFVESYDIYGGGNQYTVWIVTTQRQRDDVEFGWVSYQTPQGIFLGGWETKASYLEEKRYRELEVQQGSYCFWPPELKAQYSQERYGEDASITFPTDTDISQEEAVDTAYQALRTQADFVQTDLDELLLSTLFWRENDLRQWVVTLRKSTPPFDGVYGVIVDASNGAVTEMHAY